MTITEFLVINPKLSIFILGLLVSLAITVITYFVTDQAKMKAMKERQKVLQAEMKKHQAAGNQDKLMEINKEMMQHSLALMKHSFKPMLITWIPIIFLFKYLHGVYDPIMGNWWIMYYIIASMIGSISFRKLLKMS
jgi:uncharacterized membrane protein (DUF106 family)